MAYHLHNGSPEELVPLRFDRLDAALQEGRGHEVRAVCTEILSRSGESEIRDASIARLFLGLVELREQRFDEALQCLRGGDVGLIIVRSRALAGVGRALLGLGRHAEALALLKDGLEEFPHAAELWAALGACHRSSGESEEGWRCFVRAAQLTPADATVVNEVVALGFAPERYEQLVMVLQAYLRYEPGMLDFRGCLAMALLLLGRVEEAKEEMERVHAFAHFTVVDEKILATVRDTLQRLQQG